MGGPMKGKKQGVTWNSTSDTGMVDLQDAEVIILMGIAGVGKSTFINAVAGTPVVSVSHDDNPGTTKIQPVFVPYPGDATRRVVFVDTPGFNDTGVDNVEIVITDWLANSCKEGMKIAGIIYLYDITQARISATKKSLEAMDTLRRRRAVPYVILATTKWGDIVEHVGQRRSKKLSETYWKEMLDKGGSCMTRFEGTPVSAWAVADVILKKPVDIIIPVMGPTRIGKSTFINIAAGRNVTSVGDDGHSCTSTMDPIIVPHPNDPTRRVVFVDTPGFKDIWAEDTEILKSIPVWLARSYEGMIVAGVIYLHEISQTHLLGATRKNLAACNRLCADNAVQNVILATRGWNDNINVRPGDEQRLSKTHSEEMHLPPGSRMIPFMDTHASAWAIVDAILNSDTREIRTGIS